MDRNRESRAKIGHHRRNHLEKCARVRWHAKVWHRRRHILDPVLATEKRLVRETEFRLLGRFEQTNKDIHAAGAQRLQVVRQPLPTARSRRDAEATWN